VGISRAGRGIGASSRKRQLGFRGDRVRIERHKTPNYQRRRAGQTPRGIVIHTTVGSYASTIEWFSRPQTGVSAHYMVGLDGRIAQFVDERDTARHAGRVKDPTTPLAEQLNPNLVTIGIEFEDGGEPHTVERTDRQYGVGAALIRQIAERWGIPLDRDHVVCHREIFAAKSCPGNMDVERLLDEARKAA
jgi:N-acetylmuramoyl-L-alanine amidase